VAGLLGFLLPVPKSMFALTPTLHDVAPLRSLTKGEDEKAGQQLFEGVTARRSGADAEPFPDEE
jgi:hypothetical protein